MRALLYDPVIPFVKSIVEDAALDTYFDYCVIRRDFFEANFAEVQKLDSSPVTVSHGMQVQTPTVRLGVQVGNRASNSVLCYIFDSGPREFVIGMNFITQSLTVLEDGSDYKSYSVFEEKSNPELLTVELYSIEDETRAIWLQEILHHTRMLFNILLILELNIPITLADIDGQSDFEHLIPEGERLRISAVDHGSIVLSFAAGAKVLGQFAHLFKVATTANIAKQMADLNKAELAGRLSEEIREDIKRKMSLEQSALAAKSIASTYDSWRKEVKGNLKLFDDLIAASGNPEIAARLKARKDAAILAIVDQQLLPVITNLPRAAFPGEMQMKENVVLLPYSPSGGS
jgi:hypothetical protein